MLEKLAAKGVSPERRGLVRNWVDCDAIRPSPTPSPYRAEFGIPDDAVVALYAGNLGEKQGVDLLDPVARRLADAGAYLVICGEGAARPRLEAAVAGVSTVRLGDLQPAERLDALLNLADVHLLPQRHGAADLVMPSKLTGMLASGRPVVASAAPGTGLAQWVDGCGVVVPPGDADAMAEAVISLANDPDRRRSLGAAARQRALERLDRTPILEALERDLHTLVAGS